MYIYKLYTHRHLLFYWLSISKPFCRCMLYVSVDSMLNCRYCQYTLHGSYSKYYPFWPIWPRRISLQGGPLPVITWCYNSYYKNSFFFTPVTHENFRPFLGAMAQRHLGVVLLQLFNRNVPGWHAASPWEASQCFFNTRGPTTGFPVDGQSSPNKNGNWC